MVQEWVKELCDVKSSMKIGKTIKHPDGRKVKVIDGVLWEEHGFSNWWTWREILPNKKLGKKESGYGW